MKITILGTILIAGVIWVTLILILTGIWGVNKKINELDTSTFLLEEIRLLELEKQDMGRTIINQQAIIDNQADEVWGMVESLERCGL